MPQRIIKEHLPGIIKEKEYLYIKMHGFQWKWIKTIIYDKREISFMNA